MDKPENYCPNTLEDADTCECPECMEACDFYEPDWD